MTKTLVMIVAMGLMCLGIYFLGHRNYESGEALLGIWILFIGLEFADYIRSKNDN